MCNLDFDACAVLIWFAFFLHFVFEELPSFPFFLNRSMPLQSPSAAPWRCCLVLSGSLAVESVENKEVFLNIFESIFFTNELSCLLPRPLQTWQGARADRAKEDKAECSRGFLQVI